MTYFEVFLLAVALSVDACAVSFSYGILFKENKVKNALLLAGFTGLFQGIMPCIGYFLTSLVRSFITPYSALIIFIIFLFLGLKFIFEKDKPAPSCINFSCLMLIGIATSLDAFSAGISLSLTGNQILKPALLIACITFLDSCLGFYLGSRLQHLPARILNIFAGLILIGLGFKALL